ncbi:DUF4382 domain-containing protein [Salegentibacter sp. JZCK2]|uniref:DUF4382 domain-containing protein n=1 Tax=Salegentibacter tibetensis TaxID=2873600 RepID=UPI001CCF8C1E|nr:DUF4382 domain-containing protein [Salegentibacter tibetensis]MBZ9728774.1 DUF4382 domain-containing protein [Salegentibacter tibetensis]
MKNVLKSILFLTVAATTLYSCSSDDNNTGETANISVKMVDAPGDYLNVFVNVQAIEVIVDGSPMEFNVNQPGQYDLLELTAGNFASLLDEDIPAGRLSQIRLILGEDGNEAVLNGETSPVDLKTPSAQQSGLKLNVNYDLQPGVAYDFILDFNVDESVVKLGADQGYILKPVIRVTTEAESGAIAGVVSPAMAASVTATDGETQVTANTNTETGEFLLFGVPEGTYTVLIESAEGEVITETDIVVEIGETTQMGTVNFE